MDPPEAKLAHFRLGNAFMRQHKFVEAIASYSQELKINPQSAETIHNLGTALQKLSRFEQAMVCYQKAISLSPLYAEAYNNLGVTYYCLGLVEQAIASYRQAIVLDPASADAHSNLANALTGQGNVTQAIEHGQRAVLLQPGHAAAYLHLGNAYRRLGLFGDAIASYQLGLALSPGNGGMHNNLAETFKDQGELDEAAASFGRAIAAHPEYPPAYSNLLYFYAFTRHVSPLEERRVAEAWEAHSLTSEERRIARERTFPVDPREGRRLRLGILTAELGHHAVAEFLEPFLEHLDRSRIALTVYSTVLRTGERSRRFQELFDRNGDAYVSLHGVPTAQAAELIRSHKIDVLIETSGHTYDNRLDVIAHRAAPVQCSYIGYWSTTGLTEMDWFITGTGLDSSIESHFTEGLWRLPRLSFCYQGDHSLSQEWEPDPDGTVWLGSFNNNSKIREETLRLWAHVLHALPESKLLFEDRHLEDGETHRRILTILRSLGIEERRVEFIPHLGGHERHMELYNRLDIALDTIPFNSVTTAFDALWMGVPLITLAGNWMGGMLAASFLKALRHPEWIAHSHDEYASMVYVLARDVEKRKQLRATQRLRMAAGELCDGAGLARHLEDAIEAMYDAWAAKHSLRKPPVRVSALQGCLRFTGGGSAQDD
jgi:predicted O-linked N-acetylglucosamine transferase (SPINDLY family)